MPSTTGPLRPPKHRDISASKLTPRRLLAATRGSAAEGSPSSQTSSVERHGMKRLGSLASLHQLNPFNRKPPSHSTSIQEENVTQKDEAVDPMQEEASTISPRADHSKNYSHVEFLTEPKDKVKASRRGSWIPLPEHPTKPLPRSTTFGNLIAPAESRGQEPRPDEPRRQGRFMPSNITTSGERPSFRSRIPSAPKTILRSTHQKSLPRSDTEPLLPLANVPVVVPSRRPTLKENILPTSATQPNLTLVLDHAKEKPLPPYPERRSISTTRSPTDDKLRVKHATAQKVEAFTAPPKPRLVDIPRRTLTRFHTQPNLAVNTASTSTSRAKTREEIKYHALLSPKAPPTPVQRSPLSTVTNLNRSGSRPLPIFDKTATLVPSPRPVFIPPENDDAIPPLPDSPIEDPSIVVNAEPIPYWSGRFISQLDHWRTTDFHKRCNRSVYAPLLAFDGLEEIQRKVQYQTILSSLYADCEGEEARGSLQVFHAYLRTMHVRTAVGEEEGVAARMTWGDVCRDGEVERMRRGEGIEEPLASRGEKGVRGLDDVGRLSTGRKGTFMERLLGRRVR
ncbi:Regulatory protein cys-3 [Elsinoe australis]|uniref:Regulatory protein cys-3 n=1 Tax=Elsinoe australis TaxID=40998 RepID=A0A2P8A6D8_9PEZI|nr:Regulatory protein cys-3 [Elsinoe australis]